MNRALKEKWLKALRSGKYKQGTRLLRYGDDGDKFCCLGVLCDIQGRRWRQNKKPFAGYSIVTEGEFDATGTKDTRLLQDVGGHFYAVELMDMNDGGKSFDQIADWIEENL